MEILRILIGRGGIDGLDADAGKTAQPAGQGADDVAGGVDDHADDADPLLPVGHAQDVYKRQDLNLRPLGYEPNELPNCSTPRYEILYTGCNHLGLVAGGGLEPPTFGL